MVAVVTRMLKHGQTETQSVAPADSRCRKRFPLTLEEQLAQRLETASLHIVLADPRARRRCSCPPAPDLANHRIEQGVPEWRA
jgi:hypothetical protein